MKRRTILVLLIAAIVCGVLLRHHLCWRVWRASVAVDNVRAEAASVYRVPDGGLLVSLGQEDQGPYILHGNSVLVPSRGEYVNAFLFLYAKDPQLKGVEMHSEKGAGPDPQVKASWHKLEFTVYGNRRIAVFGI